MDLTPPPPPPPATVPPDRAAGAAPAQVLLAEDNPVNALVAQAWLQRLGVQVTAVGDGEQAVEQAGTARFDLVLMDCQMPGVDGFEATRRIRSREQQHGQARVPIVALTASAMQADRERCLAAGMDEHLSKPFDEAALRGVLQRHIPAYAGR